MLSLESGHAAGAGSSDGLAPLLVLHVTGRKHTCTTWQRHMREGGSMIQWHMRGRSKEAGSEDPSQPKRSVESRPHSPDLSHSSPTPPENVGPPGTLVVVCPGVVLM